MTPEALESTVARLRKQGCDDAQVEVKTRASNLLRGSISTKCATSSSPVWKTEGMPNPK